MSLIELKTAILRKWADRLRDLARRLDPAGDASPPPSSLPAADLPPAGESTAAGPTEDRSPTGPPAHWLKDIESRAPHLLDQFRADAPGRLAVPMESSLGDDAYESIREDAAPPVEPPETPQDAGFAVGRNTPTRREPRQSYVKSDTPRPADIALPVERAAATQSDASKVDATSCVQADSTARPAVRADPEQSLQWQQRDQCETAIPTKADSSPRVDVAHAETRETPAPPLTREQETLLPSDGSSAIDRGSAQPAQTESYTGSTPVTARSAVADPCHPPGESVQQAYRFAADDRDMSQCVLEQPRAETAAASIAGREQTEAARPPSGGGDWSRDEPKSPVRQQWHTFAALPEARRATTLCGPREGDGAPESDFPALSRNATPQAAATDWLRQSARPVAASWEVPNDPVTDRWPELPQERPLDWRDALTAERIEAERRRKLDLEQLGMPWNE